MVKVGDGPGVQGLEASTLDRGEVFGEREGDEVVEGAADLLEPARVLDGAGRDGEGRGLRAQAAEGIAQQVSTVGLVGASEELDQAQGLTRSEADLFDALEDPVLVHVTERAQGVRERRADGAPGQPLLCGAREAGADGQPRLDPALLVPQEPRDAARGQPFLLGERAGHPRLVERGDGARRGVGQEQQPLVLGHRGWPLDHHGDLCRAPLAPALKTLEAVEHFEAAIGRGGDAQRQLGQLLWRVPPFAWAKPGEAGAKPADGQRPDGAGGLGLGHGSPVAAPRRGGAARSAGGLRRSEGVGQRQVGDDA